MLLSLLLVIVVAMAAYGYVRTTRAARQRWLQKLALPGVWHAEEGIDVLELQGELSGGSYVWSQAQARVQGHWHLTGHKLTLHAQDGVCSTYDVHLFRQGYIGLEDAAGQRLLLARHTDNVVPLHKLH
ncbi:MAG: hypothetical protein AAF513_11075 [Pseudomonadota bacterium]